MLTLQPQIPSGVEIIFQDHFCLGWITLHWHLGSDGGWGGMFGFLFSIEARTFNRSFNFFAKIKVHNTGLLTLDTMEYVWLFI